MASPDRYLPLNPPSGEKERYLPEQLPVVVSKSPLTPEISREQEPPADGVAAIDKMLGVVARRIKPHTERTGWFSRWQIEKAEKALKLVEKHVSTAGNVIVGGRRIVEERTALDVALINRERQLLIAERDLINARLELDRAMNFEQIRDQVRGKEHEDLLLRWDHVLEELRAFRAEAKARVATAEAIVRDLAEQPAGLPVITVDDLRKKGH